MSWITYIYIYMYIYIKREREKERGRGGGKRVGKIQNTGYIAVCLYICAVK